MATRVQGWIRQCSELCGCFWDLPLQYSSGVDFTAVHPILTEGTPHTRVCKSLGWCLDLDQNKGRVRQSSIVCFIVAFTLSCLFFSFLPANIYFLYVYYVQATRDWGYNRVKAIKISLQQWSLYSCAINKLITFVLCQMLIRTLKKNQQIRGIIK